MKNKKKQTHSLLFVTVLRRLRSGNLLVPTFTSRLFFSRSEGGVKQISGRAMGPACREFRELYLGDVMYQRTADEV